MVDIKEIVKEAVVDCKEGLTDFFLPDHDSIEIISDSVIRLTLRKKQNQALGNNVLSAVTVLLENRFYYILEKENCSLFVVNCSDFPAWIEIDILVVDSVQEEGRILKRKRFAEVMKGDYHAGQ